MTSRPSRPAPKPPKTGGRRDRVHPARLQPIAAWGQHHLYALFSSLGQILRTPLSSLMTAAVIGIALALPTGLYVLLENAVQVSQGWDKSVYISLFLQPQVSDAEAEQLAQQLESHADIALVQFISRAQALAEFRELSGFSDAIDALEENPLPAVLVIQPTVRDSAKVAALLEQLATLPAVEVAQFDMRWLQRLFAIMEIVRRGVLVLALFLGLAVLLVIGNTIRLAIHSRQEEIEITKLFGATDSFIRRPFLYTGMWFGLLGGIIAWLLVETAFYVLAPPVRHLAALYYSDYELMSLDPRLSLLLLLGSMVVGLLGAWLAVGRHLRAVQPR